MFPNLFSIISGYLIGSIPSAQIVGLLSKGKDMRMVGDGRLGTAEAWRKLGKRYGILVLTMDAIKGVSSVLIARYALGLSLEWVLVTGFAAVVGHNWSIFLKFYGGLGAVVMYGVLLALAWWQWLVGGAMAILILLIIKNTYMSTAALLVTTSVALFLSGNPVLLSVFPLIISLPMIAKYLLTHRKISLSAQAR
jgi:glycerol-3-phosphate acyltransferase PlsY